MIPSPYGISIRKRLLFWTPTTIKQGVSKVASETDYERAKTDN